MTFDPDSKDLCIAVVGTGAMGRGIAQIAAQAGIAVLLHDTAAGAAHKARDALGATFETLRQKGKLSAEDAHRATARLRVVERHDEFAGASLIVEAIVEDLDAKRTLFRALEAVVGDGLRAGDQHLVAVGHGDRRRPARIRRGWWASTSSTRCR